MAVKIEVGAGGVPHNQILIYGLVAVSYTHLDVYKRQHYGRGDAWCFDPRVAICFADPALKFDFAEPRREFAKGAIREFMPAGERSLIIPAR